MWSDDVQTPQGAFIPGARDNFDNVQQQATRRLTLQLLLQRFLGFLPLGNPRSF
jgi:hypothetical protein